MRHGEGDKVFPTPCFGVGPTLLPVARCSRRDGKPNPDRHRCAMEDRANLERECAVTTCATEKPRRWPTVESRVAAIWANGPVFPAGSVKAIYARLFVRKLRPKVGQRSKQRPGHASTHASRRRHQTPEWSAASSTQATIFSTDRRIVLTDLCISGDAASTGAAVSVAEEQNRLTRRLAGLDQTWLAAL